MKRELRDRWIGALLSGKYKQTQNRLRDVMFNIGPETVPVTKYCCLGVLCDLVDPEGWYDHSSGHKLGHASLLRADTCETLGLPFTLMESLARRNDHGANFEQIAEQIFDDVPVDEETKDAV